jgi:hypothetical protein
MLFLVSEALGGVLPEAVGKIGLSRVILSYAGEVEVINRVLDPLTGHCGEIIIPPRQTCPLSQ